MRHPKKRLQMHPHIAILLLSGAEEPGGLIDPLSLDRLGAISGIFDGTVARII